MSRWLALLLLLAGVAQAQCPLYSLNCDTATPGCAHGPGSAGLNLGGPFTLSAWFNTSNNSNEQGLVEKCKFGGVSGYILRMNASGKLFGATMDASAATTVTGSTTVSINAWHHTALVYDQANLIVYLDGTADGTVVDTRDPAPGFDSQGFNLGLRCDGSPGTQLQGLLKDVIIYARALSSGEVATLATGALVTGNIVSQWCFLEGSGTTTADSQDGNTLTVNGTDPALWSSTVPTNCQCGALAPTAVPTDTPTSTPTLTPTNTGTPTNTFTPTPTGTLPDTPTPTVTPTVTPTQTFFPTPTPPPLRPGQCCKCPPSVNSGNAICSGTCPPPCMIIDNAACMVVP